MRNTLRGGGRGTACGRRGSPFRQGLLSNLGNPKMPVFFTSLLPQFGASFPALAAHGLLFAGLTLAWLLAVARTGRWLAVPRVRRAVEIVTATRAQRARPAPGHGS